MTASDALLNLLAEKQTEVLGLRDENANLLQENRGLLDALARTEQERDQARAEGGAG